MLKGAIVDEYLIKGGNKLSGKVKISVSKNAVLPIMCASILTKETVYIKECPKIADVFAMIDILNSLGVKTEFLEDGLYINANTINSFVVKKELADRLRASSVFLGALTARTGKALLFYPGGCKIGERPLDIHIKILKSFGVNVTETKDSILTERTKIKGKEIRLDFPSVGATQNAIMIALFAEGKTTLENCAREPEIEDFCNFLISMGAKIVLDKRGIIVIEGCCKLHGTEYKPISDRIEAGTFLLAPAICGGEIEISGINTENIFCLLTKLCENTCKITIKNDIIYLKSAGVKKPFVVSTGPHPKFPTDLQAPISVLACLSHGVSVIEETIFSNRFLHVPYLKKMGAKIEVKENCAFISGVSGLRGAEVSVTDLRAGAALVLAGLSADGETLVKNVYHIKRGYENFTDKLKALGADIFERY